MTLSSAFVVANSLRLQRYRIRDTPGTSTPSRIRETA
jgi:hypothetical protein